MNSFLHSAFVIGRRDFVASVWSRSFLLFLLGPLLIIGMSAGFGSITQSAAEETTRTTVAIIAPQSDRTAIEQARERLAAGAVDGSIPAFSYVEPGRDPDRQVHELLQSGSARVTAVLTGGLANPRLTGGVAPNGQLHRQIALVVDEARQQRANGSNGAAWKPALVPVTTVSRAAGPVAAARALTSTIGQFLVFFLTVLLSGMLLSNLLEEKSNKIIEVLAAAVPVDAIFLGKVVSMLAISLTGIAVWGAAAALGGLALSASQGGLPTPAVGWGWYGAFIVIYFSVNYLLLGALFLGIGSQANSVREVQTLSMPITIGQMLIFALAVTGGSRINDPIGIVAAVFPFSSPLTMVARAAQSPELWPHIAGLLWQGLWVWLVVRFGAALFRRNVLKSGPSLRAGGLFRRKRRPSEA